MTRTPALPPSHAPSRPMTGKHRRGRPPTRGNRFRTSSRAVRPSLAVDLIDERIEQCGRRGQVMQRSARLFNPAASGWYRPRRRHRLAHGGLHRGGDMKHYFDESFHQLNTAITVPISTVIGPVMDQVVVLLIGLPPSTPNPWSAQIRPNTATINPTANVTTKAVLI
jgi:hypothetical protein